MYPEDGVLACKLCFGDSEPPCNPTNHPPGIIQYSRFEIITESGSNPEKQSRKLLNLKKTVRDHVDKSKNHREFLEDHIKAKK